MSYIPVGAVSAIGFTIYHRVHTYLLQTTIAKMNLGSMSAMPNQTGYAFHHHIEKSSSYVVKCHYEVSTVYNRLGP